MENEGVKIERDEERKLTSTPLCRARSLLAYTIRFNIIYYIILYVFIIIITSFLLVMMAAYRRRML